jgi:hypothetical protein
MYIEFTNSNRDSWHSNIVLGLFLESVDNWARSHQIKYKAKLVKDKIKITFSDAENYSFFALSFKFDSYYRSDITEWTKHFVFKEPMKID